MWCNCFYFFIASHLFTFYKWRRVCAPTLNLFSYTTVSLLLLIHKLYSLLPPFDILVYGCRASGFTLLLSIASFLPALYPSHLPTNLQHSRHIQRRPQGPVVRNLLPKLTRPLSRAQ